MNVEMRQITPSPPPKEIIVTLTEDESEVLAYIAGWETTIPSSIQYIHGPFMKYDTDKITQFLRALHGAMREAGVS